MKDDELREKLTRGMASVRVPVALKNKVYMNVERKDETYMKKKMSFAAALALVLVMVTASIALAEYFLWGHPLETEMNIGASDKQHYEDTNMLAEPGLEQTHAGVTVRVDQCLVDGHTAYIAFHVKGYALADGDEPGFDMVKCRLGLTEGFSRSGSFVCLWSEEEDREIYADGNGELFYRISVSAQESLVGRDIHVELGNLGTYRKDKSLEIDVDIRETWTFDWTLTGTTAEVHKENLSIPVGESGWTMTGYSISPMTANFMFDLPDKDYASIHFMGFVMNDGTEQRIAGAGVSYVWEDMYWQTMSLERVVKLEDVRAALFFEEETETIYRVELSMEK